MLTTPQARQIAIGCVQHVGGASNVKINSVLKDVDIPDTVTLDTLKRSIVRNKNIGVKSKGHQMKVKDFDTTTIESTVNQLATVIRQKAKPIER